MNTITAEGGLSDFDTIIITVPKGGYRKRRPRIIEYRDDNSYNAVEYRS